MVRALTLLAIPLALALTLTFDAVRAEEPAAGMPRETVIEWLVAPDPQPLLQYRAVRRLVASTRGGAMAAELVASTTFNDSRFAYEVESERGSSLIRRRVLRAALQAEFEGQRPDNQDRAAITPANYEFPSVSAADNLIRLELKPRRKSPFLFDGAVYFDRQTADMVRVEGALAKRPSFWTRRTHVIREYARINGVRVPIAMRSDADVFITGASSFEMTYEYLEINGQPISPRDK